MMYYIYQKKKEGWQGLVHIQSRAAAFRLQFIQRFLTGPENLVWKWGGCSTILRTAEGLCLDKSLFLVNPRRINTSRMPVFYSKLFTIWNLFQVKRTESTSSLFWILKEPLIDGSHLDTSGASGTMTTAFIRSKVITLGCVIKLADPSFRKVADVAAFFFFFKEWNPLDVLHKYYRNYNLLLQKKKPKCFRGTERESLSLNEKD